jgi:hypothetical protein
MVAQFQVTGANDAADFTLKLHRGESMVLLGMNWKNGQPPQDFVGFGIEYQAPGAAAFSAVPNRLAFPAAPGAPAAATQSSLLSPIQKFRWIHFPYGVSQQGLFRYRVTPVFMDGNGKLSDGPAQEAAIELGTYTCPGALNIGFTRGFVSSQAFVDTYQKDGHTLQELLPAKADDGLDFTPTHPDAARAFNWMGFEAREIILPCWTRRWRSPTPRSGWWPMT